MVLENLCIIAMMSISVALGVMLAVSLLTVIMFNKKVLKWYSKKAKKMAEIMFDEMEV